jgi:hypothetical protein
MTDAIIYLVPVAGAIALAYAFIKARWVASKTRHGRNGRDRRIHR